MAKKKLSGFSFKRDIEYKIASAGLPKKDFPYERFLKSGNSLCGRKPNSLKILQYLDLMHRYRSGATVSAEQITSFCALGSKSEPSIHDLITSNVLSWQDETIVIHYDLLLPEEE